MTPTKQHHLHALLLLLICSYSIDAAAKHNAAVPCHPDQASSLLQLKQSFIDVDASLASWRAGSDCCHWEGVACDVSSGRVVSLDLGGYNLVSRRLDPAIFNLTSLRNLSLAYNDFGAANLPSYGFEHLTNIIHLNFSLTNFFGQIPIGIARLKNLVTLDFSDNYGLYMQEPNFQTFMANLSYLRELRLDGVDISTSGSNWSIVLADSVPQLQILSLFLCGKIPKSLFALPALHTLMLSSNQLSGALEEIPAPWSSSLSSIWLDHNDLTGAIPKSFFHLNHLKDLYLGSNRLAGTITLSSFWRLKSLSSLSLSYNMLSIVDEEDDTILTSLPNVNYLELASCNLTKIPRALRYLGGVISLDLSNNQINGVIPSWDLELFDVGNNQIVGSFPSWLGALPQLRVLVLRSNQLNGTIWDIKADRTINKYFSTLQILDLASNNFSGNVPKGWFNELNAMMENVNDEGQVVGQQTNLPNGFYQDTVTVTFKDLKLIFTKILTTFKVIDFSHNSFDGSIPESIGRLASLHGLNMSYNNFTGQIPSQFSNLSQLESLDLSRNHITGEIPHELTSLTSLGCLDLSYNNLSGRIPQGNQFSTFSDNSFEGNADLCGVPLSKECESQNSVSPSEVAPPEYESLWQDKLGVILLFAFVGLGFGVGFALAFLLRMYCGMEGWVSKQS
ncbi:hypothetical protein CFC21_034262 [Triticum aestivum]|uniref:Leucine-rich repeat-containing N-terminal plant-type domain-containing protein n=2 Tax=Triticum aestivum TaxID=4565 RepID=A0A3B6EBE6_WHEAT|nr:hypothetical protein CFC21_034262 [Triticum aestivum]